LKIALKKILLNAMLTILVLVVILALTLFVFMRQRSFGKVPEGARLERIKKSPHYVNGEFVNLTDTPMQSEDASYAKIVFKFLFKGADLDPPKPVPSVRIDLKLPPPAFPTFTYFGHSSYLIQIHGRNILMDPVFSERASPVQYFGTKNFEGSHVYELRDMPPIDYVFLSHDHYDHMDYETLKQLGYKTTRFIVPLGVGAHLEHWGIKPGQITELDWWEETNVIDGFQVVSTPARHFSGRGFARNKSLWSSYVLKSVEYNLYLGGDSGYEKHFHEIGEKFGPFDLAILECGQYNAWWPYIHMTPEETAQAGVDLGAKVVWPVHWGKFALAFHPWNEPIVRISTEAEKIGLSLTTPAIGEQIILDTQYPNQKWWRLDMELSK
jgi:L-ascorbate metabolism protein UlaG (beta-lactamase superfamily)